MYIHFDQQSGDNGRKDNDERGRALSYVGNKEKRRKRYLENIQIERSSMDGVCLNIYLKGKTQKQKRV